MKTITIPEDVTLLDANSKPLIDSDRNELKITFANFVTNTLLVDQKFGKGMAEILSAVEIKSKLSNAKPGTEVVLENADWERLNVVALEPTSPYNPVVVVQLVSFLLAIRDAK